MANLALSPEHQVTFVVTDEQRLHTMAPVLAKVARKFSSSIKLVNVTRNRIQPLCQSLSVLSVAPRFHDCMQIVAKGIDAELACFVFKNAIAPCSQLPKPQPPYLCSDSDYQPPVAVRWVWQQDTSLNQLSQQQVMYSLCTEVYPDNPQQLVSAFELREQQSSTHLGQGVALPHVIVPLISKVTLAIYCRRAGIIWQTDKPPVHLVLALALPSHHQPPMEHLKAAACLSRNLLHPLFLQRLTVTRHPGDKQLLLTCGLRGLIPSSS